MDRCLYLIVYSVAFSILISLGLAVIFGMMRVINLAQGEFIMLGAYVCVFAGQCRRSRCGSLMAARAVLGRRCSASWSNG